MFKREGGNPGDGIRTTLRVVLLLVAILVLAGVFHGGLVPATRVSVPGIVLMLLGLAVVLAASPLAKRLPEGRQAAATVGLKLGGLLVCVFGALLVFYA